MSTDNPYESPSNIASAPPTTSSVQQVVVSELSDDAKGNVGLTLKITRIAAVIAALMSLSALMQIWTVFRVGGLQDGWTAWHVLFYMNFVFAPCWLLLAWMLWKYSKSLGQLRLNGIRHIETTLEEQAKSWLAIGLVTFIILMRLAIFLSISASDSVPTVF